MIHLKVRTEADYENSGQLYTIELSTDSVEERDIALKYAQMALDEAIRNMRRKVKGDKDIDSDSRG